MKNSKFSKNLPGNEFFLKTCMLVIGGSLCLFCASKTVDGYGTSTTSNAEETLVEQDVSSNDCSDILSEISRSFASIPLYSDEDAAEEDVFSFDKDSFSESMIVENESVGTGAQQGDLSQKEEQDKQEDEGEDDTDDDRKNEKEMVLPPPLPPVPEYFYPEDGVFYVNFQGQIGVCYDFSYDAVYECRLKGNKIKSVDIRPFEREDFLVVLEKDLWHEADDQSFVQDMRRELDEWRKQGTSDGEDAKEGESCFKTEEMICKQRRIVWDLM